jgi:tetratricopeptide (TPR) repeat protein
MLGAVYLSQHRFRDAIVEAERARGMEPRDGWNYGVIGDAPLELGEYAEAFDAFDQKSKIRPSAATYGRVAYARELQGDLAGALKNMQMATDATSTTDVESLAWHRAQIGNLHFQMGRIADAKREYEHARYFFPGHPYALAGLARVKAAQGDIDGALSDYEAMFDQAPTPELAAVIGDLAARKGNREASDKYYELSERLERAGWQSEEPQPAALARFLAERGRKTDEAVRLAESAAAVRSDIHTEDALAWSYFRAGRIKEAQTAIAKAVRTGTRDRRILYHAAAIKFAAGDRAGAREALDRALGDHPEFDPLVAPAAAALRAQLDGVPEQARL